MIPYNELISNYDNWQKYFAYMMVKREVFDKMDPETKGLLIRNHIDNQVNKVPNKPGLWEWFDENGNKKIVLVVKIQNTDDYLRVFWRRGYYDVRDSLDECEGREGKISLYFQEKEWPARWGKFIGEIYGWY